MDIRNQDKCDGFKAFLRNISCKNTLLCLANPISTLKSYGKFELKLLLKNSDTTSFSSNLTFLFLKCIMCTWHIIYL